MSTLAPPTPTSLNVHSRLVLPSLEPTGQVTFNRQSLEDLLAGQSNARVWVGNQPAELHRIALQSRDLVLAVARDGGYKLNLGSRDVYLDSTGKCVEVREPATGKRFHPRNIAIETFVEGLASWGIRANLVENTQIREVSYPTPRTSNQTQPAIQSAILHQHQQSNAAWYLSTSDMGKTPHLAAKGVSAEQIVNFANLVEKVFQRHGMALNPAQVIAITATALQENAFSPKWTAGGLGTFQHTSVRADALRKFMPAYRGRYPGASDLESQIAFAAHEMFGLDGFSGMRGASYNHAGVPFQNATTVTEAMRAMKIFEGYGVPGNRYIFARELESVLQRGKYDPLPVSV